MRYQSYDNSSKEQVVEELLQQRSITQQLYSVIVRGMVVLKNLTRLGAVGASWFWVGHKEAYLLAGFIAVIATWQLVIDRTRQIVNPTLKLSEWNIF